MRCGSRSRDEGLVRNKAIYIALGVMADGTKDILGLWIETSEGAKFWLRVMNELKNRGIGDILIAVVDGLKGFPDTVVQTCIVHLIRHSMEFASWKDRKAIAGELRTVYRAKDAEAGEAALNAFDAYYPELALVVEYNERQHSEKVTFFDRRIVAGGITRGEQRSRYDQRRRDTLPEHGISLVVFSYADFEHNSAKRLIRGASDLAVIRDKLRQWIK